MIIKNNKQFFVNVMEQSSVPKLLQFQVTCHGRSTVQVLTFEFLDLLKISTQIMNNVLKV
jgi:hypothetical protein